MTYDVQNETPSQMIVNLAAAVRELEAASRTRSRALGIDEARYEAREIVKTIARIRKIVWPDTEVSR